MKFVRHLLAACTVVGLVVALGFAWKASGAASLVSDDHGDRRFVPAVAARAASGPGAAFRVRPDRAVGRRGDGGISASNVDDMVQTLAVEGLVVAGVVWLDVLRRRRHPRRFAVAKGRAPERFG